MFVLDAIARYNPSDSNEAEGIIEQVTPRLQHANSAVVLSAIKIILKYVEKSRKWCIRNSSSFFFFLKDFWKK